MLRISAGLILGVVTALMAATPVRAEFRQFGDVIYPTVPGWSEPRGDEYISMWSELPDDRCELCRIMIARSAPASGNLTTWLDRNRLTFVDADERDDFRITQPAKTVPLGDRETAMLGIGDGREAQLLVAMRAGSRFVLTGFRADSRDADELADNMKVATNTYLRWLGFLRFRSEGAPSLLPAPVPGDIEGLWWGFRIDTVLGIDMVMRTENNYRRIMFWTDGTFYEGTPPQGTVAPDRKALDKAMLADWGNYTVSGKVMTLSYADGRSARLERDGDGWSGDGFDMVQVVPLADGSRLDGSISSVRYTGFVPGGGVSGGVASSSETRFMRDGRYQGSSFGGAFGSFEAGGGFSVGDNDEDGGTYEIRDGLVVFTPDNGDPLRAEMVFRAQDNLMIGDDFFEGSVR